MMGQKTAKPKISAKALGRSLGDFPKLSAAELKLIDACRTGQPAVYGDGFRPNKATVQNSIRPTLIRFLALGGDETTPVHEHGVQIIGAWINDDLEMDACTCLVPLVVLQSKIDGQIFIRHSHLKSLFLSGSQVSGISGDRATITGGLFLNQGFVALGEVRLLSCQISGVLDCSGGKFDSQGGNALSADRAAITGDVFLNLGFVATGEVRLLGCQIGGALVCSDGKFDPQGGNALSADGAVIRGSVFLNQGFRANGSVRLLGCNIGGDLACLGGKFEQLHGNSLSADRAVIKGSLFLDDGFVAAGPVRFASAQIGSLIDDPDLLPKNSVIDGLIYGHLAGGAPTDSAIRIKWLKKQPDDHLGLNFKPQPWENLIKVLREMGHTADAEKVAIEKQIALYHAGKVQGFDQLWHWLYKYLAGFGYRPIRTILAMTMVWLFSALNFHLASYIGLMGPNSVVIQTNSIISNICNFESADPVFFGGRETQWTRCAALPQAYTTFNPYLYSLDLILPLVDLQQDSDWSPIVTEPDSVTPIWPGVWFRSVMWFEILFGWMTSLLLVSVVGNLVKKD